MKYTIKKLQKMAREFDESYEWFDILLYWMACGNQDMMEVFNNMSKRETLKVIDVCVTTIYTCAEYRDDAPTTMNIYNCAMTSLENRI